MADVEDAHSSADRHVLGDKSGVLDRHVPAAKIDHLGAHLAMDSIQGSLAQSGIYFGGRTQRCSLFAVRKVTPRTCWVTFEINTLIGEGQRGGTVATLRPKQGLRMTVSRVCYPNLFSPDSDSSSITAVDCGVKRDSECLRSSSKASTSLRSTRCSQTTSAWFETTRANSSKKI